MKFTPEFHLKMASILLWAARATTGHRKPRLESLGHAFRIRAKQLAQSNGVTPDELSLFDTQEDWENHLADLLSQPDSVSRRLSIQWTEAVIQEMRERES